MPGGMNIKFVLSVRLGVLEKGESKIVILGLLNHLHSNLYYSKAEIGHFTAMAQDRSDRVGCAAVRFNGNERMLACNYAFTNIIDSYVYKVGAVTSGCQTGPDSYYTNICSADEIIDPNP